MWSHDNKILKDKWSVVKDHIDDQVAKRMWMPRLHSHQGAIIFACSLRESHLFQFTKFIMHWESLTIYYISIYTYINSQSLFVLPWLGVLRFNSPAESAWTVEQFCFLICRQNRLGQSDGWTDRRTGIYIFCFFFPKLWRGQGNLGLFIFFAEEGHGFYFFIFLKQIDEQMNWGFTFFVFFFLTFEGGRGTWVYSLFFQRTGTGFIFSF